MKLEEKTIHSEELTRSSFLRIVRDTVSLPDGGQAYREYCIHPGAAVIMAILDNGQLVLERQYRHPVKQVMIEFPAGKLNAGEPSLECACRELKEETGFQARRWAYAGAIYPCIGYSDEKIDIWLATDLIAGDSHLDAGEFVEVFTAPPEQLGQWALDGTITDGKTLACLNWLNAWRCGNWHPQWQFVEMMY